MILSIREKKLLIAALRSHLVATIKLQDLQVTPNDFDLQEIECMIRVWTKDLDRHERADKLSHERNQRKHSRRTQRGPIQ